MPTHDVLNQPPPLEDYDVFGGDAALVEAVPRHGAGWALKQLHELGELAGTPESIASGFAANENPPRLRTHDRFGNRVDTVEYHPAYHDLMRVAIEHDLHGGPWREPRDGAHVARAAGFMVWSQVDAGHGCPVSMTYAIIPALRAEPSLAATWEPRLTSPMYDPRPLPASEKLGAIAGMAMTEKQGGSDVRANTTRAVPVNGGGPGEPYRITGHKWFCSAPMSDAFLMLAQAPGGLSCFFVPRRREDATINGIAIQRLKDKLGNRSNASGEIELDAAEGRLVGDEGRGVPTIIQMVNHTRLDCVLGAASGMRQAVVQATHHAAHRQAFGRPLIHQPLMRNVLADLAVESEAATTLAIRLAAAYDATDRPDADPHEVAFARLATAVGKYWVCKRQPGLVVEALECLGGNGYVEESIMPRLFRESPLNGIWEGSGNVICLDVLRAMGREPASVDAFREEVLAASGSDARFDAYCARLDSILTDHDDLEARARRIVEAMALALQASLVIRSGSSAVADAFCASRLDPDARSAVYGSLPPGVDATAIVDRARPAAR
ncbi:MAG: acyl-CoA dehydrogenase family protein [Acidimicrobiia bacterium]